MTGTEVAQAAKRYVNTYKYVYGAKGELCSSTHIEELIAQSPTYFSDEQKKTAARAKAGYYCADCSGYVCICSGTSQYGSYALYDIAAAKYPLTRSEGKVLANGTYIPVGAVVWKPGHVGIYVGNQTVVEARSEFVDVEVNPIGSRDFTYCLLLPGIQYRVYQEDGAVEDSDSDSGSYTSWIGKIVNTPVVVPQISAANKQAAVGFGMLRNGTNVTVVGVSGDYYRIRSQSGYYGYVYSYYIGTTTAASYENQYCLWTGTANSTTGVVNIRIGPSTSYVQNNSVPSVANGATLEVIGEVLGNEDNRLWYYVRVLGVHEGYVRGDLVSRKVMVSYTAWIGKAVSSTGTVNIRTAPTVNSALSSLHGALANGDQITVTNETRGNDGMVWYAVSIGGKHVGYCRSDLVVPYCEAYYVRWDGVINASTGSANIRAAAGTSASKIPGSPYKNGTSVRVTGEVEGTDGYTWYYLNVDNTYVGYCRCDLIAATADYPEWWAKANTTTGTLNIRSNAGTGYALISGCPSVANGTQMKVIKQVCGTDGGVWYQVVVKGAYTGYVKATLVDPVNTIAYPVWIGCARSTTGVVNVRSQASTSSAVISGYPKLNNGECFDVIDQVAGADGYLWFYVRILGLYYGYIRSDLVSHGVVKENNNGYASWVGVAKSTTGTVNVRAGAGTGTALVVSLRNGDGVEVIGTANGTDGYIWYQVKVGDKYGYIRSDLVIHVSNVIEGDPSSDNRYPVIVPCVNNGRVIEDGSIKKETSDESETVCFAMAETFITLEQQITLAEGNGWYLCKYHGYDGYIKSSKVTPIYPTGECVGYTSADYWDHPVKLHEKGDLACDECGLHMCFSDLHKKEEVEPGKYQNISTLFESLYDLESFLQWKCLPEGISLDPSNFRKVNNYFMDMMRVAKYGNIFWNIILGSYVDAQDEWHQELRSEFQQYYPNSYNTLKPYLEDQDPPILVTNSGALVDVPHLFATMQAYYGGTFLARKSWAGWSGDLATLMGNVQEAIDKGSTEDALTLACEYLGNATSNYNYPDLCTDADAIAIAKLVEINENDMTICQVASAIMEYYQSDTETKRKLIYQSQFDMSDLNTLDAQVELQVEEFEINVLNKIGELDTRISERTKRACRSAFMLYMLSWDETGETNR